MSFFTELKRRNVFKIAIAYALVGWVLMQVAAVAFPPLGLPNWSQTLVVVLVLMGLPIAMLLAWAFEITPEGVKRTKEVDKDKSIAHTTGRKIDFAIIALLVVAVGYFAMNDSVVENPIGEAQAEQTSIAVLPFVNMSSDAEQEFFSDGISEEILNVLVRMPDLKVAGRTSSFQFKGENKDLREIGEALNVNHILEGSVRKSGTRLRITAQLIRSSDGFHLWSETYTRDVADVFDIQDEISMAIADALAVNLGLEAGESLITQRTNDIAAYEIYLHARQLYLLRGEENLKMAALMFTEVAARDPNYDPAWEGIASVYSVMPSYINDYTQQELGQWFALGEAAGNRAIALNPNSALAHAKVGIYLSYKNNHVEAFKYYDNAIELAANQADLLDTIAQAYIDTGYFAKAEPFSRRAVEIDPNVPIFHVTLARTLMGQGRVAEAMVENENVIDLDPTFPFTYGNMINYYISKADFENVRKTAERMVDAGIGDGEAIEFFNSVEIAYEAKDPYMLDFYKEK